jgi:hypothetical protein
VISGRWLYVIKNEVLVTVRPKPKGGRPSMEPSGKTRSGKAGGKARAEKMTPAERTAVAKKAAAKRWA